MLQKMKTSLGKDKVMDLLKNLMESDLGPPGDTEAGASSSSSSKIARSHYKIKFLVLLGRPDHVIMLNYWVFLFSSNKV